MLAQSLVERGMLDSLVSGVQSLTDSIPPAVRNAPRAAWLGAGVIALVILWLWTRRRS